MKLDYLIAENLLKPSSSMFLGANTEYFSEESNDQFEIQNHLRLFTESVDGLLFFESTEHIAQIRDQNIQKDDRDNDGS